MVSSRLEPATCWDVPRIPGNIHSDEVSLLSDAAVPLGLIYMSECISEP